MIIFRGKSMQIRGRNRCIFKQIHFMKNHKRKEETNNEKILRTDLYPPGHGESHG